MAPLAPIAVISNTSEQIIMAKTINQPSLCSPNKLPDTHLRYFSYGRRDSFIQLQIQIQIRYGYSYSQ